MYQIHSRLVRTNFRQLLQRGKLHACRIASVTTLQIYIIIKYIRFRLSEFIRLSARKYTYRVEEVSGDQNHVQHLLQRLVRHEVLAGEYHRVDAWLQVAHIRGEFFLQQHALNAQLITTYQLKRTSIYNT